MPERTRTPVRTKPQVRPETDPERRYAPDEVCPSQKDETVRRLKEI